MTTEKGGRPIAITPDVLRLLEDCFLKGHTDSQACFVANIGMSTLYDYCKKNPEFASRKELLKENVAIRAKDNIVKAIIDGDKEMSKWYSERKAKDEFSLKTETAITNIDSSPFEIIIKK